MIVRKTHKTIYMVCITLLVVGCVSEGYNRDPNYTYDNDAEYYPPSDNTGGYYPDEYWEYYRQYGVSTPRQVAQPQSKPLPPVYKQVTPSGSPSTSNRYRDNDANYYYYGEGDQEGYYIPVQPITRHPSQDGAVYQDNDTYYYYHGEGDQEGYYIPVQPVTGGASQGGVLYQDNDTYYYYDGGGDQEYYPNYPAVPMAPPMPAEDNDNDYNYPIEHELM